MLGKKTHYVTFAAVLVLIYLVHPAAVFGVLAGVLLVEMTTPAPCRRRAPDGSVGQPATPVVDPSSAGYATPVTEATHAHAPAAEIGAAYGLDWRPPRGPCGLGKAFAPSDPSRDSHPEFRRTAGLLAAGVVGTAVGAGMVLLVARHLQQRDQTRQMGVRPTPTIPTLTTAERDALPSSRSCDLILNRDTGRYQVWTGTAWRDAGDLGSASHDATSCDELDVHALGAALEEDVTRSAREEILNSMLGDEVEWVDHAAIAEAVAARQAEA